MYMEDNNETTKAEYCKMRAVVKKKSGGMLEDCMKGKLQRGQKLTRSASFSTVAEKGKSKSRLSA